MLGVEFKGLRGDSRHQSRLQEAMEGVRDEILVVAVPRPGEVLVPDEIADWCAEHLAPYKRPRLLTQVGSLPYTPSHRVAKFKLKQDPTLRERAVELTHVR